MHCDGGLSVVGARYANKFQYDTMTAVPTERARAWGQSEPTTFDTERVKKEFFGVRRSDGSEGVVWQDEATRQVAVTWFGPDWPSPHSIALESLGPDWTLVGAAGDGGVTGAHFLLAESNGNRVTCQSNCMPTAC